MPRDYMLFAFGVGAFWSGLTTAVGIGYIIQADAISHYLLCVVGGLVIGAFGLGTRYIFDSNSMPFPVLQALWYLALAFDVLTSFGGTVTFVILRRQTSGVFDTLTALSLPQVLLAIGLTVLVSSSPIMLAYVCQPVATAPAPP